VSAALTKHGQAADVIDVGIGEQHTGNGRAPRYRRMKRRKGLNLSGDVGRTVE
jgi:hypothetical protein